MSYARVTLLPFQQAISVEAGETILNAALRAGLNLPHSCKSGHCSSCRARVIAGKVDYPLGRPSGLMEDEERAGYALLCQAHAASCELTIEVRHIHPAIDLQVKSLPCRIEHMQLLAADVMAVFLRLPAADPFTFLAGQYIDIMLPQNRRRSFSIANPPHDAALLELHIRKVAHGEFTQQIFAGTQCKALLRIEGPLGQFWFREQSTRAAILIGGGTGYAPLRAMLRSLLERGDRRNLHLYWGARSAADLYEDSWIRELCLRHANLAYTPVLSAPHGDAWHGRVGWVHDAVLQDYPNLQHFDVYASGPPAMVEAVRREFRACALPATQLYFDSFDFAPDALAKLSLATAVP